MVYIALIAKSEKLTNVHKISIGYSGEIQSVIKTQTGF